MEMKQQIEHLGGELDRLVDRFRAEYDLPYSVVVGCLVMKANLLCMEAVQGEGGDGE